MIPTSAVRARPVVAMAAPPDGGGQPVGPAHSVRARPRHLLFHDPAADAAEAEEGGRVPRRAEGRRQGRHLGRHLRQRSRARRRRPCSCRSRDKVRVEISRAAIVGYQGQAPVVRRTRVERSRSWTRIFAGKSSPSSGSSRLRVGRSIRPSKKVRLGLDLKGGVHLVLRVQTDDALRLETETTVDRLRDELVKAGVPVATRRPRTSPTEFRSTACRPTRTRSCAQRATDVEPTYDRDVRRGGNYTFKMKPNIANQLRDETVEPGDADHRAPRQRAGRRRADRRAARRRRSDHRAAARRHRRARAKEIIRSTALLELKLVEQGPFADEDGCTAGYGGNVPPDIEILPGRAEAAAGRAPRAPSTTLVRRVPVVTRPRPAQRATPRSTRTTVPAVSFSLNAGRRAQVRQLHRREHRPPAGHRARQPRLSPRRSSRGGSATKAASPATSRSRRRRICR